MNGREIRRDPIWVNHPVAKDPERFAYLGTVGDYDVYICKTGYDKGWMTAVFADEASAYGTSPNVVLFRGDHTFRRFDGLSPMSSACAIALLNNPEWIPLADMTAHNF